MDACLIEERHLDFTLSRTSDCFLYTMLSESISNVGWRLAYLWIFFVFISFGKYFISNILKFAYFVLTTIKPDYCQLFRLFSTAYFFHAKDGSHTQTNVQSHTMQGIAVGWSNVANGMEIYNPVTKQLHTTTV